MCTVSYLPLDGGFVLSSNRDERPDRATLSPEFYGDLYYPRDLEAQGTWIAWHRQNRLACLLNGAEVKHAHKPPYRRSRGLILLDLLSANSPIEAMRQIDLEGVEPFTLVFVQYLNEVELYQLRWDGIDAQLLSLDPQKAQLWSSATLYDAPEKQRRRAYFDSLGTDFLAQNPEHLRDFHRQMHYPPQPDKPVITVSFSSLRMCQGLSSFEYISFLESEKNRFNQLQP